MGQGYLSLFKKELNLLVPDEVVAERKNNWQKPQPEVTKGVLALYAATADRLMKGELCRIGKYRKIR
ncbi:MAG: hypothetical protein AAGU27_15550 [Dehalobacterium sp.]